MARSERERIEPVVDAAAPQHDLVVGTDAGNHARIAGPCASRRFVVETEGHDADEALEVLAVVVGGRIEPADRRELSHQKSRCFSLAQRKWSPRASCSRDVPVASRTAIRRWPVGRSRRTAPALQTEWGFVRVYDDDAVGVDDPGTVIEHMALYHHDVGALHQRPQCRIGRHIPPRCRRRSGRTSTVDTEFDRAHGVERTELSS